MAGSQKFELQLNKIVLEWDHRPNFFMILLFGLLCIWRDIPLGVILLIT